MKKISCTSCTNSNCFIKKYCSVEWIGKVDALKHQISIKKDGYVIYEESPVLGIYLIQEGKVKVISTGINDKQQIVRFANDGHILGHRGKANDVYPIGAIAMEDSLICFIENNNLNEIFKGNPDLTIAIMSFYSRELRRAENRIKNIAQMDNREKVAEALLLINEIFGSNKDRELNVPLTREDIANTIGTGYMQVARILTSFEEEGIIAKNGRKIAILDIPELQNIISEYNPHVIPN